MAGFISVILGAFFGYFIVKKQMEKRLFMILTKMGIFDEQQLGVIMAYYRDYNKLQKEASKAHRDEAMKMEMNYRLKVDEQAKKL